MDEKHFLDSWYTMKVQLKDYQMQAVDRMKNGCILNGGVGSGKSITALYYFFSQYGGNFDNDIYHRMTNPRDLYIITTARKRDTFEWNLELARFCLSPDENSVYPEMKVVVDSWNNIKKYVGVQKSFFIFDEDKVTGKGTWVKTFLKIVQNNQWIILSATPGDQWTDYIPVFIANKFYKNFSQFYNEHCVFSRYANFPKIERYTNTGRLIRLRRSILVDMDFERPTVSHNEDVWVEYDSGAYKDICRTRWDPYENRPSENASQYCYCLRKIVNLY